MDWLLTKAIELGHTPCTMWYDLNDLRSVIHSGRTPTTSRKSNYRSDNKRIYDRKCSECSSGMDKAPFLVSREVGIKISRCS